MKQAPSIELLRDLFEIRDGHLYWRIAGGKRRTDRPAGTKHAEGYRSVHFCGYHELTHRVIFAMANGFWPSGHIDHVNMIRSDNRPENLREASHSENLQNRPKTRVNKSGRKGVCWHRAAGKWIAQIQVRGRYIYLGLHDDLELAAFIYECAAEKYHGQFARTS